MRVALNMLNHVLGQSMDQWYLIDININAPNFIKKESWIYSFKKFNIHPHTRSTFDVWIRKLEDRGFLSAKKFFENRTTIYDAMPDLWRKKNILSLSRFVRIEDVFKLCACYLTAKLDPYVIVSMEEEESSNSKNDSASPIDQI